MNHVQTLKRAAAAGNHGNQAEQIRVSPTFRVVCTEITTPDLPQRVGGGGGRRGAAWAVTHTRWCFLFYSEVVLLPLF